MNTIGDQIKLTIYGESHGASIGAVLDGLPAGVSVDWDEVRREMERRAPGRNALSTDRKEKDAFEIQSGYFNDHTTGTPLCVMIRNGDQHSKDYDQLRHIMRPGHADYAGHVRYGGYNDYRGGGHFSGRLTAPLVFAGAIAKQVLQSRGITVGSHIQRIAGVEDARFSPLGESAERLEQLTHELLPLLDPSKAEAMKLAVRDARSAKDSVGGLIEVMAVGLPAGLGDPLFDSVESALAHMLFSVPAVKGVEFGDGFALAQMRGSEANDAMQYDGGTVKTLSNHNGGITGGITNGAPLLCRLVIKPTASIAKAQRTVDLDTGEDAELSITGRHDPCIVQRAVPVVEAATAWVLLDILLQSQAYTLR